MKVYADISLKAEFEMPDAATDDEVYDMAISKFLECTDADLKVDMEICRPAPEYYGEMM